MTRGYISIGSNIDREHYISSALRALEQQFGKLIISSTFETEPIGFSGNFFYNLVIGFDSDMEVITVSKLLKQIENDHGRTRNGHKFSARTLDLDLLLYGNLIMSDGRLQIPREEINQYAFVLEPLAEIAPELEHPIMHQNYADLWEAFDKSNLIQKRVPFSKNNAQK